MAAQVPVATANKKTTNTIDEPGHFLYVDTGNNLVGLQQAIIFIANNTD